MCWECISFSQKPKVILILTHGSTDFLIWKLWLRGARELAQSHRLRMS